MSQSPEVPPEDECEGLRVGIVAIGGAGISILTHLKPHFPFPRRSIAIDLNQLPLKRSNADHTILVGKSQLNPKRSDRVRFLAKAVEARIRDAAEGLHLVFLLCGLGGMAGTYITPFVADVLRRMNILTTAAVVMPFAFEGASRHAVARKGLASLRNHVDAVFALPGVFEVGKDEEALGLEEAIQQRRTSFGVLYNGICHPFLTDFQLIGLDFEDLRTILSLTGQASFRHVVAGKDVPLQHAARDVFENCLKEHAGNFRPQGVFVSFGIHRREAKMRDINDVMNVMKDYMTDDTSIVMGYSPNPDEGQAELVFVFTGL